MKISPIGIENFKELIDSNAYYVDKTNFIKDILNEKFVLYTRPRRFGKTLNMSMLYYFFSNKEKANAYLFDGLDIAKDKEAMKHQNQYPVILMSLKDLDRENMEMQVDKFKAMIASVIEKNSELIESPYLSDDEKELLKLYRSKKSNDSDLRDALLNISVCLEKHYKKKVIILIDEYDVPLQRAYVKGYYEEMVDFLRNIFSSALKTNDAAEKGILTGCLRISKESIFTGLNNFNVHSILDDESDEYFGFTEEEIKELLNNYNLGKYYDEVKEWYDGYLFGSTEIYNPWSTLKYVYKKVNKDTFEAMSFWVNTSGNDIVYNYIKNYDGDEDNQREYNQLHKEFEILMNNGSIRKQISPELTYREMDDYDNIYSFLLLTGYLKVVKDYGDDEYELVIPNKEVFVIYKRSFEKYFNEATKIKKNKFYTALLNENVEEANKLLNEMLFRSISYFDNREDFYHGLIVGIFFGERVVSNREAGYGRFDICVYPEYRTGKVIVIECKHTKKPEEFINDAKEGVQQIKDKKYIEGVKVQGYSNVIGYGISFLEKECYIVKL